MRITTLGTSHGDHTYCRFNSSTLIEIGERSYLIDAGAPVGALLIRAGKETSTLKAVFVTHMHQDHVDGLPGLIKALVKYPQDGQHTTIFLPEADAFEGLGLWLNTMHVKWPSPLIDTAAVEPGHVYADDRLTVTSLPTRHMASIDGAYSCGYRLEAEGKRAVFTGDLRGDFSDFPQSIRDEPCDVCVSEMTHFKPETALPILKECPIGRLIFHHIHNPWHGEGEETLRAIFRDLPYPFEVAHDGDVFEV